MPGRRARARAIGAALALVAAAGAASSARAGGDAGAAPRPGQPVPDFTLPDLEGRAVRLADFRGKKAVLINFWATWCLPCREEMPTLERLSRQRQRSLQVLGVNLDTVGVDRVRAFVGEVGATFPILLDPDLAVARRYRVRALPVSFIVDRAGLLRRREIGYRDWASPESQTVIEEVLRRR